MSLRAYYNSSSVNCKNLLWEIAIIKNMSYHVKKLPLNRVWSMDSSLRSLKCIYLSLTFQLSQTAVVKGEISYTFLRVPVKLNNSQLQLFNEKFMLAMSLKGVSNCFAIYLWFRFALQLETTLETYLQGLLLSLQLEETEQLVTVPVKLSML